MRIGELAATAGVSTRAVRHYHRRGLLPEPPRRPNGYREYGLRDVITLARIRRLTELGLTLDEVAHALADDTTRDLHEILRELDDDLARQQRDLAERRARLAVLIDRARPHADDAVPPDLLAVLDAVAPSPMAERERELLALLDRHPDRHRIVAALGLAEQTPDTQHRLHELVDAGPDDPRIPALAADIAATIPPALRAMITDTDDPFSEALLDSLTPAQAEVIRHAIRLARP
ncbi:MerR family transcriptional regulator [Actinophytocola gossypii]|uniref:MerR family transcriptional regulator n=1 Tax=Actinophytocola gossypii TaxID=2812003 RepID=A0ABT2JKW7_9PSEU|nr:MerR family transcriptional regulator [Actinophytocola gossypii]MCT2588040.1 MerR family transcriptional regulator [Actinophytocola gossypii]